MLYQGFHLCCVAAPDNVTCPEDLEGIQDLMPQDVEMVRRWIQTGIAPPPVLSLPGAKVNLPTDEIVTTKPYPLYLFPPTCVLSISKCFVFFNATYYLCYAVSLTPSEMIGLTAHVLY